MTEGTHYDVEHLSTEELRAIAGEVWNHWQAVIRGEADEDDLLYADPAELSDEYAFWMKEIEDRIGYDGRHETAQDI